MKSKMRRELAILLVFSLIFTSFAVFGTPTKAFADEALKLPDVLITEVVAATDETPLDTDGYTGSHYDNAYQYLELYNPSNHPYTLEAAKWKVIYKYRGSRRDQDWLLSEDVSIPAYDYAIIWLRQDKNTLTKDQFIAYWNSDKRPVKANIDVNHVFVTEDGGMSDNVKDIGRDMLIMSTDKSIPNKGNPIHYSLDDAMVYAHYLPPDDTVSESDKNVSYKYMEDSTNQMVYFTQKTDPTPGIIQDGQVPKAPEPVVNPTVTFGNNQATVSWSEPTDIRTSQRTDYTNVDIYDDNTGKPLNTSDILKGTTLYTITGLENGTDYKFRIETKNANGLVSEGLYSDIGHPTDGVAPVKPTGLTGKVAGGAVSLSWDADTTDSDLTKYVVYRYQDGQTEPEPFVDKVNPTSNSMKISGEDMVDGQIYQFAVEAWDSSREKSISDKINVKFEGGPSNVVAVAGDQTVSLNWDLMASSVLGYQIYVDGNAMPGSVQDSVYNDVYTVSANTNTYAMSGLTNGQTYTISVAGVKPGSTPGTYKVLKSTPVQVAPYIVNGIAISGLPDIMFAGAESKTVVTATYNGNTSVTVSAYSTYSSSDSTIATVDASGLVKALGKGTTVITATYAGKVAQTAVNVRSLDHITLSGVSTPIEVGATKHLVTTAVYSDKFSSIVTDTATYSSSRTNVATIDTAGLLTAVDTGSTVITATYQGQSATLTVNVQGSGYVSVPGGWGTIFKETDDSGKEIARVNIKSGKLSKAFEDLKKKDGQVVLDLQGKGADVVVQLPADALADGKKSNPDASILIKVDGITYEIPVKAIDVAALAKKLGVKTDDLSIEVRMEKVSGKTAGSVKDALKDADVKSLSDSIEFSIYAKSDKKSQEVTDFGGAYLTRTMEVKGDVKAESSTGVLIDPKTKEVRFVPTVFKKSGKNTIATIQRQGNSIYAVVQSKKSFDDLKGHWSKDDVELLASKLLVNGVDKTNFSPDSNVTRAEFAAMLVRSLGLDIDGKAKGKFKDVKASDWFAGEVAAAEKAGLINGYDGNVFKPNAKVTREEMVVMLQRAIELTGTKISGKAKADFKDKGKISDWAKDAVSAVVKAKIIEGMNGNTFAPKANASRAQAAVALKRLLEFVKFIN